MKTLKNASRLLFALALVAVAGCSSDSPTEPSGGTPATPKPPEPTVSYNVTVSVSPPQLTAGDTTPATVTVDVRRADNGLPPADSTPVTLTTTLGDFGSVGSGQQSIQVQLVNGRAQAALFPGAAVGRATVQATFNGASGAANVDIVQQATFHVASITPNVGAPAGGETVNIEGGGFDGPVRVTFNGTPAQVLQVTPTRIRVRTPSATAAGVSVGSGQSVPVTVGVTVNVNEVNEATDTLSNGFIYSSGGGQVQPPIINSVTPTEGPNEGGTVVTILGSNFQEPIQVRFGGATGVEAQVQSVSSNRIVVISPSARGFGANLVNQVVDIMVRNMTSGFTTVSSGAFRYGVDVLITGLSPDRGPYQGGTRTVIFGQGFDEPVSVRLGGVTQDVISVSSSEIVIRTSGITLTSCPSGNSVPAVGVTVTNLDTGDSASNGLLSFNYEVPLPPQALTVSPVSGGTGTQVVISGRNLPTGSNAQVLFGSANGSVAPIVSSSPTAITVNVPLPPAGFSFNTRPCDSDGDNDPGGTEPTTTPITVVVRNLETSCVSTLTNVFGLEPTNPQCTGDDTASEGGEGTGGGGGTGGTTQCNDGIDNDGDGRVDFGFLPTNDPQCDNAADNSEAS
ncbi:MAG TPA: IPT/TIG domain-containing protein [Thermoanaerobaculia bacterium]|nr:IPT/TIG domain-containing protein [Thermoanaerobaculia bacterium]